MGGIKMRRPKVYVACKMTGLTQKEMVNTAIDASAILHTMGFSVYHPVLKEGIPKDNKILKERSDEEMHEIWEEDQKAIREADLVIDTAPHLYSTGARREHGKVRYDQWKPYVSVWPKDFKKIPFIARKEDDATARSVDEAGRLALQRWGTRWKRIKYKFPIYLRHWDNISLRKIILLFK